MTFEQQEMFQKQLMNYSTLKSVQILSALAFFKKECGINDIAQLTNLSSSTIHRILHEFVSCGLAVKVGTKYRYRVMLRSLFVVITDDNYLLKASELEMDRLNNLTKETVHLIVQENCDAVYLDKREAQNQIGLQSVVGKHVPMYCTSGGKVLMAYQSRAWLDNYYAHTELKKLTETTITDPEKMAEELAQIRKQGYALDNSEHNPDVVCIAAPVFFPDGKPACTIGVATPKYRMTREKMDLFIEESVRSAKAISENLK